MSVPHPIAISIADLHLTLQQPVCRADEDWMKVQASYLKEINDRAHALGVPILCAGDIFDKPKPPPELINFALQHLPDGMLCVPGQHDLVNHRWDLDRCGYGVLVRCKKIRDISGKRSGNIGGGWTVIGFGWNQELRRSPYEKAIALVHKYVWAPGSSYPGAPEDAHYRVLKEALKGFAVAVFGDNHKGFTAGKGPVPRILNCGGFIRRKSDEMDYVPSYGILYSDGTVTRTPLDISADKFQEQAKVREGLELDLSEFIAEVQDLGEHGLNFKEAVKQHIAKNAVDSFVAEIIKKTIYGD